MSEVDLQLMARTLDNYRREMVRARRAFYRFCQRYAQMNNQYAAALKKAEGAQQAEPPHA